MLFYKSSDKPEAVIARCRDAAKSTLGIVLPIDDSFVIKCLNLVANKNRQSIDKEITDLYQLVVS